MQTGVCVGVRCCAVDKNKVDPADAVAYENAAALYNEALTLYREQHMQHAIANFVAAVKLYPALADGWFVCL